MTAARPSLRSLLLPAAGLLLFACGGGTPTPPPSTPAVPATAAAPSPAPTPAPAAAPATEAETNLISVRFVRVTEEGFPEVEMKNLTGRGIETIQGSFLAHDAEGVQVWGTGLTVAVPGQTFLAAGQSRIATPFGLNKRDELMETLRTNPDSLRFSFAVREIGYLDE